MSSNAPSSADRPLKGLSIEEARTRMLARVPSPVGETVPLLLADGRTLTETVEAVRDQPPFDASAMDGWAVRSADAGKQAELRIVGESAAGHGFARPLGPGEAVRIFTGAPVPAGADLVVIQEETDWADGIVRLTSVSPHNTNIRPRGGDFRAGERLLEAGVRLDPWRLSLAAAAGRATVTVARRPRIALLATGEELTQPGATPGPWQIFESGSVALAGMIGRAGGEAVRLTPAGDDIEAIVEALRGVEADLIVTVGGASVGDHDLVKPALARLGLALDVGSVAIRPGKPTWFGRLEDGRLVLGLPGNPASAFVCAELFLRPLVLALQGAGPEPRVVTARLAAPLPANGPREHWMRARLGSGGVAAFADQDSSLVAVFAAADCLLRRRAGAAPAAAGDEVDILPLERS